MAIRKKNAEGSSRRETVVPAPPAPRFIHTRLLVEDMDRCYRFYRDVLGFRPRFDGEGSVYAEFEAGHHTLALFSRELMNKVTSPGSPTPRGTSCDSVLLVIEVNDVDEAYAKMKTRGVEFVTQPHDQKDWMLRVAHFRDPDGNLLEINCGLSEASFPPTAAG